MERCGRCGAPATTAFAPDMLSWTHGGGTPYCERCVVEEQLEHALEASARVPELQEKLVELGGPAQRVLCGYTFVIEETVGGTDFENIYCVLDKGHDGDHEEE